MRVGSRAGAAPPLSVTLRKNATVHVLSPERAAGLTSVVSTPSSTARVRRTTVTVWAATLGPASPLPRFTPLRELPYPDVGPGATPDMLERMAYGRLESPLPYPVQEDYDRSLREVELPAYVLENGVLRATVLPTLGGRVWSLYDDARGRELLFRNPVLHFANFGLTNAWFAGGIEWNLGSTGHTTLSCRPMHAAVVAGPDGDVLRLWEWERTRDLVLQVDLSLPPGADRLYASTRVINPDPEEKPLYYWTNIAVPESPGTRVLTTANAAWRTEYTGALARVPVPHPDRADVDISYPMASRFPADYFYDLQGAARSVHRGRSSPAAPASPRRRRAGCGAASCSCGGAVRPAHGGRNGSAVRERGTPRSRRAGARRSSSTTGWPVARACRGPRRSVASTWTRARWRADIAEACAAAQAAVHEATDPDRPRGHPRALAHRGGRRRGRRAGEHGVRLGSCRAQAPGLPGRRTDPGPAVPTRSTTTVSRHATCSTVTPRDSRPRSTGCRCPRSPTAGARPRGGAGLRVGAPGPRGERPPAGRAGPCRRAVRREPGRP